MVLKRIIVPALLAHLCLLFLDHNGAHAQGNIGIGEYASQKAEFAKPNFWGDRIAKIYTINRHLDSANRLKLRDPESAERLALAQYVDSRQVNFYYGAVWSLAILASIQDDRGNFDSAIALYQLAVPLALRCHRSPLHKVYINISSSFSAKGNYEQALEYNYRALNAISKDCSCANNRDSAAIFLNITKLWHIMGEQAKALESLSLLKKVASAGDSSTSLLYYYRALIHVSPVLKDSQILNYAWEAVRLSEKNGDIGALMSALNSLCLFYIARNRPDSARICLNRQLDLFKHNTGFSNLCISLASVNEGRILQLEGKYQAAEKLFSEIYDNATSLQLNEVVRHLEPYLAEAYHTTGKNDKAYQHMKHFAALQDSILSEQKTRSVGNWAKSRIAEKDKQLLKKQLLISVQTRQLQHKTLWIMAITFFSLLLISVLINFIRGYRSKQKIQQGTIAQLRQMQQIEQLKAQVRGEEQERSRIATELHDNIASQLWAIKLNLDHVLKNAEEPEQQQQNLETIYRHVNDVAQEIRETAHNLMPGRLLDEGLGKAIARLCERIEKSAHLDVEFQEYGTIPYLDVEIQLSMFRMIQELVQNVLKHANATWMLIQLSYVNSLLNITIEDNGSGIVTTDMENEWGLQNIQRRVEVLQGQFELKSAAGKGTTIYIEFDVRCFPEVEAVE